MFLKVETLKFDRGRSFEIAKRSSSIGVSNSSKNEHSSGSKGSCGTRRWSAVLDLLASSAGVRITAVLTNSFKNQALKKPADAEAAPDGSHIRNEEGCMGRAE